MTNPNLKYSHSSGNITPYDFFTSHVYSVTGYSPLSLFFIGAAAGALSGVFIYLLAREIFSRRIAKAASIFAFFWPSFILWSTQHLKEPMITMLVGIALWTALYAYRHVSAGFGVLSVIAVFLFFKVSAVFTVITISGILVSVALVFLHHLLKNKFVTFLAFGVIVAALLSVSHADILGFLINKARYSIAHSEGNALFEFLDYHRSVRAYGNLQIAKGFSISNPINALIFAPIGFIYAIFAPFPWQIGSLNQIIAIPETIIFYICMPATLRGIIFSYKKRFWPTIILLSIIFAILGSLALLEGNSGTLFRHRSAAFYLIFIFTACGMSLKKNEN